MFSNRPAQQLVLSVVIGIALGCLCGSAIIAAMVVPSVVSVAFAPSPTPTATATRVILPTITLAPTLTRTPTFTPLPPPTLTPAVTATSVVTNSIPNATPTITRIPAPTRTPRPVVQHFVLGRPVMPSAEKNTPALFYLYGATGLGELDVHHGEEFVNPVGTPLYAVADGTIVVAGSDERPVCGDDGKTVCGRGLMPGGYYGKLIVLQLDRDYTGERVFALYGHVSQIGVEVGAKVKQGEPIGVIGSTGVAQGPHLHFEVRFDVNDYAHTRNPILWMTPLSGRGAIAGRFADPKGAPAVINLYRAEPETFLYSIETYGHDKYPEVNSDDDLGENFAMPDLAPGDYIVRVSSQPYAARVTVEAGRLAFVELGGQ